MRWPSISPESRSSFVRDALDAEVGPPRPALPLRQPHPSGIGVDRDAVVRHGVVGALDRHTSGVSKITRRHRLS